MASGQRAKALLNGPVRWSIAKVNRRIEFDGRIAQLVEQLTLNQRVQGSSPCAPTIKPEVNQRSEDLSL